MNEPQDMAEDLKKTVERLDAEILALCDCLRDVLEMVDDYVDIDNNGGPNLAMRITMAIKPILNGE